MYPELHDATTRIAILNNIIENQLVRKLSFAYEFSFTCYEERYKTDRLADTDVTVYVDGNHFDIRELEISHDLTGRIQYDARCEHVFYRLADPGFEVENYDYTGTPTAILSDILTGTDFSVGTVDYTEEIAFAVNRKSTKMGLILTLVNFLGGEIGFTDQGFTINIRSTIGQNRGFQIRVGKNLAGIRKHIDRRGTERIGYEVDLVNVGQSEDYKSAGLESLETVEVGDVVQVIDDDINVNIQQSVLEITRNVIKAVNLEVVLANSFETLADTVNKIEDSLDDIQTQVNNLGVSYTIVADLVVTETTIDVTYAVEHGDTHQYHAQYQYTTDTGGRITSVTLDNIFSELLLKEVATLAVDVSSFHIQYADGTTATYNYSVDSGGRITSVTKV